MAKSNGKSQVLDIPVEFGGVSIGEATARLGIRANRSVLNINSADEVLCGHRLTGRVVLGGEDDEAGQGRLVDDMDHMVSAVFDCKRIGVNPTQISAGLTFNLADVDIKELARFSKGAGRLVVEAVSELPEDADDGDDDISLQAPSTLKVSGPLRDVQLDTLFHGALLKSLKKGGLTTVGQLADFTASNKRLTDISGIGPEKAEKIQNQMVEFWRQNPEGEWKPEPAPASDDWRQAELSALGLTTGVVDMFREGNVTTIGGLIELKAAIDSSAAVWPKGIGPTKQDDVMKRLEDFREKHEGAATS